MHPKRKQRLILISLLIGGLAIAIGFALMALQQNINLFFSPTQVVAGESPADTTFRLGGMVVDGSIERSDKDLSVKFVITDTAVNVPTIYTGILPDLFGDGQGVVVTGKMQGDTFIAESVLAKHDENYMPPEASEAIKMANKDLYDK